MKRIFTLLFLLMTAATAFGQMRYFYGNLSGTNEVPPSGSTASGIVVVRFNTTTKLLELFGNYNTLSANISGSHIHVGSAGLNGPVIVQLANTGGTSGTLTGIGTLTAPQEDSLLNGKLYANIHSTTFTGGEIRSQLLATTVGQTEFVNARIQSAQEVPVNSSTASGIANALVDKTTNKVYLTGNYAGLTTNISASHIHLGAPGVNGGVALSLINSGSTSGTLHAEGTLTAVQIASLATGGGYVNVHSTTFAGGEIRGQLTGFSQQRFFAGRLSGTNEIPANGSTATGVVIVRYNMDTKELELTGDYQGLTGTISGSHIHVGSAGINGPVIISLTNTGGSFGTLTGTGTLTVVQEDSLLNSKLYVNIHSTSFLGGEIRVQLMPGSIGATEFLRGMLQASQEVPTNASTATGSATVFLDRVTRQVFATGNFAGLTSNVSGTHIHRGQVGFNGPVIINLAFSGTTSGNFSGTQVLSQVLVDSMINGLAYVNIHSANFPNGEVRAQLGDLVLPVKLAYINGYKDKQKIILNWESVTEVNVKHYEVEQQNTITNSWIRKATITATGIANGSKYKAEDLPENYDQSYVNYRLKMVDKDGRFSYSPVVKINLGKSGLSLSITNNPVKNSLNYLVTGSGITAKSEVVIIDQNGKSVYRAVVGGMANNSINTSLLSNGVYTLIVQSGNERVQKRFIKQ